MDEHGDAQKADGRAEALHAEVRTLPPVDAPEGTLPGREQPLAKQVEGPPHEAAVPTGLDLERPLAAQAQAVVLMKAPPALEEKEEETSGEQSTQLPGAVSFRDTPCFGNKALQETAPAAAPSAEPPAEPPAEPHAEPSCSSAAPPPAAAPRPAAAAASVAAGGADFHDALRWLAELHEREVAELRAENQALRAGCGGSASAAAHKLVVHSSLPLTAVLPPREGPPPLFTQDKGCDRVPSKCSSTGGVGTSRRLSALNDLMELQFQRRASEGSRPAQGDTATLDQLSHRQAATPPEVPTIEMGTEPATSEPEERTSTKGSLAGRPRLPRKIGRMASSPSGEFEVLSHWRPDLVTVAQRRISFSRRATSGIMSPKATQHQTESLTVVSDCCLQGCIMHPSSQKRLAWDIMSMALLAYDIIVIPFVGAFDPPTTDFMVSMTWGTLLFWTLDMPMSMLTGFHSGKQTVMSPMRVLKHYAFTWFFLDCFIIGLDWTLVMVGNTEDDAGSAARLGRTLRTLRFIRTLRLIRVLKLKRIVQTIQDLINTETVSICFGITKIILSLVIANHIVACGWYGIGLVGEERGVSWIQVADMDTRTLMYRYTTSLHWSLTQFTPASMEVFPQTVSERIFSVIVLLFAMIAFSSFVSMLTASMAELKKISSDESRQFWLLRRYLRDWGVRRDVSLRIQRYLEYAYQKQRQRVQEKDVALLALLSEPLREDLKHATFARHLSAHPLFQHCEERTRIFGRALAAKSLAAGDLIFACGEQARRVVFLTGGTLEYTRGEMGDSPSGQTGNSEAILENQWVGEAVLWTTWLHLGDLVAITESQIITIDARVFGDQVQINRPLWLAVQHYATKFVSALNQVTREDLTDLIDRLFPPSEAIDMLDFFDQSSTAHNANDNFVGTVSYVGIWERISSSLFGRQNGIENVQNMSSIGVAAP